MLTKRPCQKRNGGASFISRWKWRAGTWIYGVVGRRFRRLNYTWKGSGACRQMPLVLFSKCCQAGYRWTRTELDLSKLLCPQCGQVTTWTGATVDEPNPKCVFTEDDERLPKAIEQFQG